MDKLYKIVKEASEYYNTHPIQWFSIIAMDGDVTLRVSSEEFKKHPALLKDVKTIPKEQGISYRKEIEDIVVETFEHIPQEEDAFQNIYNNICELDAEWYLMDSIKWLMFDYWYNTANLMLKNKGKTWTQEQKKRLEQVKEAINYVE